MPPLYPLPGSLSRRSFITGSTSLAAALLLSSRLGAAAIDPKFSDYPFKLGIASGDPSPDGFVLWTRLAPSPLVNGGGMPADDVAVDWEVFADEALRQPIQSGRAVALAEWAHSVHVEVAGLEPDRWYWYRFKSGGELSQIGRARTMPAADTLAPRLRFAFVSCQHYEAGFYTAYEHLAREDIDLVVHLGDYIYEGAGRENFPRRHGTPEPVSLDDYRNRYALYKTDAALQNAHAVAPWIVTPDDHEVENNYAGLIPQNPAETTPEAFALRRAAAYQAYYEHMPLRRTSLPSGPGMQLFRRLAFGSLATFHVLDTRQYRTDQPCGDGRKPPCPESYDEHATLLGETQRRWLFDALEDHTARWNILAQQIMMARVDRVTGEGVGYSMDQWPGYENERRLVLRQLRDAATPNPIVISGDIHSNWANELLADFDQPDSPPVAVEFVGTSISSDGNGIDRPKGLDALLAENPFVKFHNAERGYVLCDVTPDLWRADFRTVAYVDRPGAPLQTRASFEVAAGHPALKRV